MTQPTLQTIDTKLDMYMASTDKAITAMSEAVQVVSKSQAESKTMQVEINALNANNSQLSNELKETNREIGEMKLSINNNANAASNLENIRNDQKAMGNKLLGSLVFAAICAVATLFFK